MRLMPLMKLLPKCAGLPVMCDRGVDDEPRRILSNPLVLQVDTQIVLRFLCQSELRDAADDDGYLERHLWTGIGRARSGAGIAIVGDPDQVAGKLRELRDAGVSTFILSGYPHLTECDLVARHVLPQLR